MKLLVIAIIVVIVLSMIMLGIKVYDVLTDDSEPIDPEVEARDVVISLSEGDFEEVYESFNKEMAAALSLEQLEAGWNSLIDQYGDFVTINGTSATHQQGYDVVCITCEFSNATLEVRVVFDKEGKIAGLNVYPIYTPPEYADPELFDETECTVGTDRYPLPATLTLPKGEGPFPAVVLVHGSGPNDRDESLGGNKPFKDLAWASS